MYGGCNTKYISYKAKKPIGNMSEVIKLHDMKKPEIVCKYFTSRQMKRELTESSTDVYLRFYSSFMLYLHQSFKTD